MVRWQKDSEEDLPLAEASAENARRRAGTIVRDKYRIDAFLAQGSMASVYAATHRNGNRVALKILRPELSADPSMAERFRRESYFVNAIAHPGVVRAIDDDVTDDGSAFIVMDLLEGETLAERRRRLGGRVPLASALQIADVVLDILAAAHGHDILHRDLKPDNVFVTLQNEVKLLDFGVARFNDGRSWSEMTDAGMIVGTPAYMAPEQALGKREEVDARSDIWGVGAMLFSAISGESVHPGADVKAQLLAATRSPVRSLRDVVADVPRAVASVVDRALAFDKAARWSDAASMREALRWARIPLEAGRPREIRLRDDSSSSPVATARTPDDPIVAPPSSYPPEEEEPTLVGRFAQALLDNAPTTRSDLSTAERPAADFKAPSPPSFDDLEDGTTDSVDVLVAPVTTERAAAEPVALEPLALEPTREASVPFDPSTANIGSTPAPPSTAPLVAPSMPLATSAEPYVDSAPRVPGPLLATVLLPRRRSRAVAVLLPMSIVLLAAFGAYAAVLRRRPPLSQPAAFSTAPPDNVPAEGSPTPSDPPQAAGLVTTTPASLPAAAETAAAPSAKRSRPSSSKPRWRAPSPQRGSALPATTEQASEALESEPAASPVPVASPPVPSEPPEGREE